MAVPYTFSTATGSLPLSQLDSNFSTAITIGNTAVVLGDTIATINNLTLANVAITSVSTAFPNGYLANSNVIVGTTTLTLGSTVTSINGLSLSNVTISSGNVTISNVTTTNVTATTANVTTANVGTLVVIGDATVGGNTTVTGNITAAKGTFTSANVTGTANVQVIAVTQNATVAGNVTITGNVSAANGTFTSANVSGTANVSTLAVVINATIGGNATVTGNVTAAKLIPTGSSVTGNGLYLPAANSLGLSTNGTNAVYIDSSQNVGIGIAPSAWSTYLAIQFAGYNAAGGGFITSNQNTSPNSFDAGYNTYYNGTNWIRGAADFATRLRQTSGQFQFFNTTSSTAGSTISWTQAMTLDASGKLSVGTTSNTNQYIELNCGATANNQIRFLNNGTYYGGLVGATSIGGIQIAANAVPISFSIDSGSTQAMTLNASGNLGIGTSSPSQKLEVAGNVLLSNNQYLGVKDTTGAAVGFPILTGSNDAIFGYLASGTTGISTYQFRSGNNVERMRIDSVGNAYIETGLLWQYAPTPTTKAAAATLTAAELATDIITLTGTTYTITLPTGTALDTYYTGVPAVNIGYDFHIVNTASGIITIAVGASGMTSVGLLTVAATVSAHFRLRRTAANTYILYRLS